MLQILIKTERLLMRRFTLDDAEDVYELSICDKVTKYTGDGGVITTKSDAEKVIKDVWLSEYDRYGYARYALIHKGDNKLIGFCGVKFDEELGCPDIAYRMLPEYWGQGLGTEAVKATIKYAHEVLHLNHIAGEVVVENIASIKILENLGFQHTATYEQEGFKLNRYDWRALS
jgi:RimJ/RimL family protein N-acetyltransferase